MKNKFTRIALDNRSIKLMINNDDPDRERKAALLSKVTVCHFVSRCNTS